MPYQQIQPDDEKYIIEKYRIYIEYIRHENSLINQRTTWLVLIQAAFFTILAGLLLKYTDFSQAAKASSKANPSSVKQILSMPFSKLDPAHQKLLISFMFFWAVICVLGITTSILSLFSINAAAIAQHTLNRRWTRRFGRDAEDIGLPELMGGGDIRADKHGARFAKSIPWTMIVVWIILLFFEVFLIGIKFS